MKSKLILICAMVTISLCLFACSSTTNEVSVEASCNDFYDRQHISKKVEVAAGDSFVVTLCSNPSTGREWEPPQVSDKTILSLTDHERVGPETEGDRPPAPGTPGKEIWTFKALKKGETTISMEWSQPWEGGVKAEWTFDLTVVVK